MTNKDILKQHLSKKKSTWKEDAKWRKENDFWLETSQRIAIKILLELRNRNISKTEFSFVMGVRPQQVNTILKGRENLTLKTIRKIERVLNIELISIVDSSVILSTGEVSEYVVEAIAMSEKMANQEKAVDVVMTSKANAKKDNTQDNNYAMAA
ncbi:MAG: helix-turn-helix transcriptional regulator [Sphingobacteriaceae bacterium]|nr:helix-turn-helix transcriptional regulator [Sphingobacteriaceae bacterium]